MKKLLIIAAVISIAIGANAQKPVILPKNDGKVIKFDPNKSRELKTTWTFKLDKLPLRGNYTTDILARLNITFEVKDDINKGQTLYFTSTMPIHRVDLSFKPNNSTTSKYGDGVKEGHFYLESGNYKSGLKYGYKMLFYLNGITEPVAQAQIIPLKSFK